MATEKPCFGPFACQSSVCLSTPSSTGYLGEDTGGCTHTTLGWCLASAAVVFGRLPGRGTTLSYMSNRQEPALDSFSFIVQYMPLCLLLLWGVKQ